MEVMEFFLYARRPESAYRGTLAFHFRLPQEAAEERKQPQQQQKQQLVLTVRVQDGVEDGTEAAPPVVIFQGLPPDGEVSAHVHCSLGASSLPYSMDG